MWRAVAETDGRATRNLVSTVVKAVLLTVHTALSVLIGLVIVIGFHSVFIPDGSNFNPGGMIAGLLTAFVCAPLPCLAGSATWKATHG